VHESWIKVVALLVYLAFAIGRWWLRSRQRRPEPAERPAPRRPPPAAAPRAPAPAAAPRRVAEPWLEMDRRAADLAALPDPWAAAGAFAQAGRLFFRTTPGLEPEMRARTGLPRTADLPSAFEGLVARQLALPMGPWLETLFADAWATLALGPAYAVGLRRQAPDDATEAARIVADAGGTGYGPVPPAHLRILLCCDLLSSLGHSDAAARQIALWRSAVGPGDRLLLPTRESVGTVDPLGLETREGAGEHLEVPVEIVRAFGSRVVEICTSEPLAALSGANLAALPGLRFTPKDQAAAEQAASVLGSGQPARAMPRVLLAAALLAADQAPGRQAEIRVALRRSLAPAEAEPAAPRRRPTRAAARRAAPSAAFLDVSPAAWREAMIARAILWR
jgi:hypothetical protein